MRSWMLLWALALVGCFAQTAAPPFRLWTPTEAASLRTRLNGPDPTIAAAARKDLDRHAWNLLKLVTGKSSHPIWYWDWCTIDEVYSDAPCPAAPVRVHRLRPKTAEDLPSIETVLSSSYYNPAMAKYLRRPLSGAVPERPDALKDQKIALPDHAGVPMLALAKALAEARGPEWSGTLPVMPDDAVIVKPVWFRVPCPDPGRAPTVGVYHGTPPDGWDPDKPEHGVKISPESLNHAPCSVPVEMMVRPDPAMLRLDDFMYFRSKKAVNFEVIGVPQGQIGEGDYLLLMGLHVITHEQAEWVWTTFWWTETPTEVSEQPDWVKKDKKLRHFNMRTTVNMGEDPDKDAISNPYIEGRAQGGSKAHCIACHRNASLSVTKVNSGIHLNATTPPPTDWKILPDSHNSIDMRFIWSITLRANEQQPQ